MPSELLKLTAKIVISHASMSELTPKELVRELKEIYSVLNTFKGSGIEEELISPLKIEEVEAVAEGIKKSPIALNQIVQAKYVVCLECGKKLQILKTHLRKAHQLTPQDYFKRYGLDPKKYPLVCKEYSEMRRKSAIDRGFGTMGGRRKATT